MAGDLTRRNLLRTAASLPLAGLLGPAFSHLAQAAGPAKLGPAVPFSFTRLCNMALELAGKPFQKAVIRHGDRLDAIDFDTHNKIKFRPEGALWADGSGPYPVEIFHPGRFFKEPISLNFVEGAESREVLFDPSLFVYEDTAALKNLPPDLGFAGFKILGGKGQADWLAFLGAAYFRSSGESGQFGLSARGIAIDTALPTGEEFPRFTSFWLEEPGDGTVVISALMDGPSIAGAYRMRTTKARAVVMEIEAVLYPRKAISRMGVAPLTSMFWYSESSKRGQLDWRPQVHDSDGLAIWTGGGEYIWRPLNNPLGVQTSSFFDRSPKGFGLLQRNRDFANYQDDGVFYEKRPSAWIEPLGDWGAGSVQLVEIPTVDETNDNIVAYWVPAREVEAGQEWRFAYRLTWADRAPHPMPLGIVNATRVGISGIPGQHNIVQTGRKFVVDFNGGPLDKLPRDARIRPIINVGRGVAKSSFVIQVQGTKTWRAFFDYFPEDENPVDFRMYLAVNGDALTETWIFQYVPKAI